MATELDGFGRGAAWVELDAGLRIALERVGSTALGLGTRGFGEAVTDHRSSWVRHGRIDALEVFCKTYDYPGLRDTLRGVARTTCLAAGRARREAAALRWLAAAELPGPRALGVAELRRAGWLRRSLLVTAAWPGAAASEIWSGLDAAAREELAAALSDFAAHLHARGFVDGNLDPRNLLVRRTIDGRLEIAKIDSPRFRVLGPGRRRARAIAADRARLARGLERLRAQRA